MCALWGRRNSDVSHSYYSLWALPSAAAILARTRPLWFGSCACGLPWEHRVGSEGRCKRLCAAQRIMPRTASPNYARSTGPEKRSPFFSCSVSGRHLKTWPSCRSLNRARIYRSLNFFRFRGSSLLHTRNELRLAARNGRCHCPQAGYDMCGTLISPYWKSVFMDDDLDPNFNPFLEAHPTLYDVSVVLGSQPLCDDALPPPPNIHRACRRFSQGLR
ncbi:hypothetical protein B0H14DRAFT_1615233 [Mycena olivaceomarginata]|nr:hypothetical protein B0H14DRAFT_1615233 [Mycena olivaceomarginata]